MKKCTELNFKKERRKKKPFYLLITLSENTLRQELLCALVDVMLTQLEIHQKFPNPVCRCLRFHH